MRGLSRATVTTMRKITFAAVAAMLALGLSACGGATAAPENSTKSKPLSIGALTLFPSPFFTDFENGMKDAASKAGTEVKLQVNDVNSDVAKESEFIQTYITQGVDAIVLSPVSGTGSKATMKQAGAANIPLICFNTCLSPSDTTAMTKGFVTSDQAALGKSTGTEAAAYIAAKLGGTATVGFATCETFEACKERRQGLDEALSKVKVSVADAQEAFVVDKGVPVIQSMLTAHPDINVLVVENEDGIVAAANAVKAAGLEGKVAIFGIGIDARIAKLVKDGEVMFTTGQDPYAMGQIAVEMAIKASRGDAVDPALQYAAAPTYSKDDPKKADDYIAAHK
jgi:sugar transport system substrate-binding protein